MAKTEIADHNLSIKLADQQWEFLENRTKELGISKEELVKWYIISDMIQTERDRGEKERSSLKGIFKEGKPIPAEVFEEAKAIWKSRELL